MIWKITVSIVALLAFVAAGYLYLSSDEVSTENLEQVRAETAIDAVFNQTIDRTTYISKNFSILDILGNYARATFQDAVSGEFHIFFILKTGGNWRVVSLAEEYISCEKMEKYGFPTGMISDCVVEFPNAKTVSEVLEGDSTSLPDEENSSKVIADILFSEDPSCLNCVDLSSGGGTVSATYEDSISEVISTIQSGDTVVVDLSIENSEEGESSVTVSGIDKTYSSSVPEEYEVEEEVEEEEYNIQDFPPQSTTSQEFYQNLFDIDNSFKEIQIIGD